MVLDTKNPRIEKIKPIENYTLVLTFTNKEVKIFDMQPYLNTGILKIKRQKQIQFSSSFFRQYFMAVRSRFMS